MSQKKREHEWQLHVYAYDEDGELTHWKDDVVGTTSDMLEALQKTVEVFESSLGWEVVKTDVQAMNYEQRIWESQHANGQPA